MRKYIDISGKVFGRLTAIKKVGKQNGKEIWLCHCSCGNDKVVRRDHLLSGAVVSCKCYQREKLDEALITHGCSNKRIYRIYKCMINRCYWKKHPQYKYWGGKGITVCDEWRTSFVSFMKWSYQNGYREDLSIDRIDSNGNYSPENCKWATPKEQSRNREYVKNFEFHNEKHCLTEWAEILNLSIHSLRNFVYRTGESSMKKQDRFLEFLKRRGIK